MKTKIFLLIFISFVSSFLFAQNEMEIIGLLLDDWHQAAANADQQSYFDFIAVDGIYIGTDATENWTKDEFFEWSKSYFENGKAWSFTADSRNIYISENRMFAWFDELLSSGSVTLRGSGVLKKVNDGWKLKHYVLSLPVPNDKFKEVIKIIKEEKEQDAEKSQE